MNIEKEIESLIKKVCKKWDYYKSLETVSEKGYSDYTAINTLNGYTTEWNNPNLLWILSYSDGGRYDGSGLQIGLSKDGKFYWEYQSHCSCNGFSDSSGHGTELCLGCDEKPKSYELTMLPSDYEKIIKVNLEEILKK